MRKISMCLILVTLIMLISVPVSAQDRQFRQHHSIQMMVECLDTAMEIIRGLNGYNLDSSVFLNESAIHGAERWAHFTRRVDYWAFRHVQEALRDMGEVLEESENAYFLGAQIVEANVRIIALTQEIERLSLMMAGSDSLDVLIAIDWRLSEVTWERNRVIGTRNVLIAQAASPIIDIWLYETPGGRPEIAPPRFGTRIADNFTASWRATRIATGHLLVFMARVSVPVLVYVALAFMVIWVCLAIKRRRAKVPVAVIAGADVPDENAPHETVGWLDAPLIAVEPTDTDTPPELTAADEKEGES